MNGRWLIQLMPFALALPGMCPPLLGQSTERASWWGNEPLRIIDVVTSFAQLTLRTPAAWADLKAARCRTSLA